jgi:hypothetical protein
VAKRPKYNKTKALKAIARQRVGSPPPARTLENKTVRAKPKHKKPWPEEDWNEPVLISEPKVQ